ncbi:hypothetical protein [Alkalihalobacillus sp. AL-G]|uniref:hypothetical protein n=1 Tax=Alkalihalobacillus sp. AL-G TaxID=2926399 RepID=UPI00272D415B|nr:hypothetical protein [Alkalihalobacillus sp. AL-G]WLD92731.1 hypothetical protein MOJ78_17235 [Alkalihalobacillus sp. AL-G]
MKFYVGVIIVTFLLITGCTQNDIQTIEGKINDVNKKEQSFVVYVGDTLTNKQRETMDFEENEKIIEAFLVETTKDTVIKGELDSFNDLKMEQKVSIEIKGNYEKELVTTGALFEDHEKLPSYQTEKITVIPYSKQDIVSEMTVDKDKYGLYIYNPKPNENGGYSPPDTHENVPFQRVVMKHSNSEVKNTKELLGLFEDSPTYIVTDDKGILFKANNEKELDAFIETLAKQETD